ncbi:unnamed protein product, partial [Ectocarpus sp. 12 AP-2014]
REARPTDCFFPPFPRTTFFFSFLDPESSAVSPCSRGRSIQPKPRALPVALLFGLSVLSSFGQKGQDLLAMDMGVSSDPLVIFKLGGKEQRSRVIQKNLNPQWEEVFEFECRSSG